MTHLDRFDRVSAPERAAPTDCPECGAALDAPGAECESPACWEATVAARHELNRTHCPACDERHGGEICSNCGEGLRCCCRCVVTLTSAGAALVSGPSWRDRPEAS